MKKDINPFKQDEDESPDAYQKDILNKINELKNKSVRNSEQDAPQSIFGANSRVSGNLLSKTEQALAKLPDHEQSSITFPKRSAHPHLESKPRKITQRAVSGAPIQSEAVGQAPNNRKITDFYGNKKHDAVSIKKEPTPVKDSAPIFQIQVRKLELSIEEKEKSISALKESIAKIKERNQSLQNQFFEQKQTQKQSLIIILKESFQKKIYHGEFYRQVFNKNVQLFRNEYLNALDDQIRSLKAYEPKKRNKKSKRQPKQLKSSDDEENRMSDIEEKQKKQYMAALANRFQKQRIEYIQDKSMMSRYLRYLQIPSQFSQKMEYSSISKDYTILCKLKSFSDNVEEILALQLNTLNQQIMTVIRYPPFTQIETKELQLSKFQDLLKVSRKFTQFAPNSMVFVPFNYGRSSSFISNTIVAHLSEKAEQIIISRQHIDEYESLYELMKKFDVNGSEHPYIVKYILKNIIKALHQIYIKTGFELPILPSNIFFTEKYQIKFANVIFNKILFGNLFRNYLTHIGELDYYPPQAKRDDQSNLSLWSIGVLVYQLCFNKKPFPDYSYDSSYSRDEFFVTNEIEFPAKSPFSQKWKDLIKHCLMPSKQKCRIIDLLNHPFFTSK